MSGAALVRPPSRRGFLPPTPSPSPQAWRGLPLGKTAWGEGLIEAGDGGAALPRPLRIPLPLSQLVPPALRAVLQVEGGGTGGGGTWDRGPEVEGIWDRQRPESLPPRLEHTPRPYSTCSSETDELE
jgi:hypothetical protein